jgi:hypothetical protein
MIQRYDLERVKYEDGYSMIGVELGDYVLYTDHLAATKEKEEEIANLKCVMGNLLKQLDKRDMVEGMEGDC